MCDKILEVREERKNIRLLAWKRRGMKRKSWICDYIYYIHKNYV